MTVILWKSEVIFIYLFLIMNERFGVCNRADDCTALHVLNMTQTNVRVFFARGR